MQGGTGARGGALLSTKHPTDISAAPPLNKYQKHPTDISATILREQLDMICFLYDIIKH